MKHNFILVGIVAIKALYKATSVVGTVVSTVLYKAISVVGTVTVTTLYKTISVVGTVYNYFIPFCATVKTITHEVLWMTRCTVARGRRPRATVYRVIHSTEGVIVLTVAQKCMK